jgi:hypothetical protein
MATQAGISRDERVTALRIANVPKEEFDAAQCPQSGLRDSVARSAARASVAKKRCQIGYGKTVGRKRVAKFVVAKSGGNVANRRSFAIHLMVALLLPTCARR